MVKLKNAEECKAYYYEDKMRWLTDFKLPTSHWWRHNTNDPLLDVTHWRAIKQDLE